MTHLYSVKSSVKFPLVLISFREGGRSSRSRWAGGLLLAVGESNTQCAHPPLSAWGDHPHCTRHTMPLSHMEITQVLPIAAQKHSCDISKHIWNSLWYFKFFFHRSFLIPQLFIIYLFDEFPRNALTMFYGPLEFLGRPIIRFRKGPSFYKDHLQHKM